jgi:hypothetical protein
VSPEQDWHLRRAVAVRWSPFVCLDFLRWRRIRRKRVGLMRAPFSVCPADIRGQAPIHEEWDSSGFDVSAAHVACLLYVMGRV